jgi:hypothetical protein
MHAPTGPNLLSSVMPVPGPDPGIVAGIHVFLAAPLPTLSPRAWEGREGADVDGGDKPGHDFE